MFRATTMAATQECCCSPMAASNKTLTRTLFGFQVTAKTQAVADFHMELLLKEAYEETKVMMARNRGALGVLVEALLANSIIRCIPFARRG